MNFEYNSNNNVNKAVSKKIILGGTTKKSIWITYLLCWLRIKDSNEGFYEHNNAR